jgi:hypothetical protein
MHSLSLPPLFAATRGCDEIMKLLSAQPQAHATGAKNFIFYLLFIFYLFYLPLTSARMKAK